MTIPWGDGEKKRLQRMRRGVLTAANGLQGHLTSGGFRFQCWFGMLTYAPDREYSPKDISRLVDHLRKWAKRRGIEARGLWVMEMQERGAPHYHFCLWLPRGYSPPKPDKQGWWPHGWTSCKRAHSPVGYVAKYASKIRSKGEAFGMPPNARLWGVFGMPGAVLDLVSWWLSPGWLRAFVAMGHRVVRQSGGWWLDAVNRIRYRSPWVYDGNTPEGIKLYWIGWTSDSVEFV